MTFASSVLVRPVVRGDLQHILDVHAAHGSRTTGPATDLEVATWDRMLATDGLCVYLAQDERTPVGTASTIVMPNLTYDCAPTLFIEAVVVVPNRRREGIASTLLARIIDDATTAGCRKMQLLSHKRHARDGAHALYRKAGFEPEAEGFRRYLP